MSLERNDLIQRAKVFAEEASRQDDPLAYIRRQDAGLAILAQCFLPSKPAPTPACAGIWRRKALGAVPACQGEYTQVSVFVDRTAPGSHERPKSRFRYPHHVWKMNRIERDEQVPRIKPALIPNMRQANNGSVVPHHPGVRFRVIGLKPHDWDPPKGA